MGEQRQSSYSFGFGSLALWGVALVLCLYGVFFIYSAGYVDALHEVRMNWIRQLFWLGLGAIAGIIIASWKKRSLSWRLFLLVGYCGSLVALVVVLLIGTPIGGARRWLSLGGALVQPAEFARFFSILLACHILAANKSYWKAAGLAVAVVFPVFLLIFIEPSAGNACSLLPVVGVLLLLRTRKARLTSICFQTVGIVLLVLVSGLFFIRMKGLELNLKVPENGMVFGVFRSYHLKRIEAFLSPRGDWNERQSVLTVASGGLHGRGYLNGTMKGLGYLPRTVAPTDFIFAVIAEEGGFLYGSLPLLGLYGLLLWVIIRRGLQTDITRERYYCAATATLIFVHVVIGVGMAVRLVPVIGLPLPLVSYGGSFAVMIMMFLGAVDGTGGEAGNTDSGEKLIFRLPYLFRLSLGTGNKLQNHDANIKEL